MDLGYLGAVALEDLSESVILLRDELELGQQSDGEHQRMPSPTLASGRREQTAIGDVGMDDTGHDLRGPGLVDSDHEHVLGFGRYGVQAGPDGRRPALLVAFVDDVLRAGMSDVGGDLVGVVSEDYDDI